MKRRYARVNPRRREDIGKPWDVVPPTEYLPPTVARIVQEAVDAGQHAWCGAWSPTMPGQTAHLVVDGKLRPGTKDVLVEAGFKKGWIVPGHWVWSADGESVRPPKNLQHALESKSALREWRTGVDTQALLRWLAGREHRLAVLGAAACARYALRFVPSRELRQLRAIETAEAWARGDATVEQVRVARDAVYAAADAASSADAAAHAAASAASSAAAYAPAYAPASAYASAYAASSAYATSRDRIRKIVHAELADVVRYRVDPFGKRK